MAELTPNDIINKEFRTGLRGYAVEQVDDFLQQISDRLHRVLEENRQLRTQVEDLRSRLQQYQQTEELMRNALILAEKTAEETRQRAHQEADLIRREAVSKLDAERMALEDLRQTRKRILVELRSVLNSHLSLIEAQEERGVAASHMYDE